MMNKWTMPSIAVIIASIALFCIVVLETTKPHPSSIDTSALNSWCGDYCSGKIKMVGAHKGESGNLVDEQGNEWNVPFELKDGEFYLAWICDNDTQYNVADDYVIKLWAEVH